MIHVRLYFVYRDQGGEYVGLPMNLQNPPRSATKRKGKSDRVPSFGKRDRHLSEGERLVQRPRHPERQRHLSASEKSYQSGSDREGGQSGPERETKSGYGRKGAKIPKP